MKTPTHLCLGWLLTRAAPDLPRDHKHLVLLGSVAPDIPLTLAFAGLHLTGHSPNLRAAMDQLYFHDAIFITVHHLLHSPLNLALILFLSLQATLHGWARAQSLTCFTLGALTHALADTLTHGTDGLLVFWPVNWVYRFDAGINQWDTWQGALIILTLEALIIAATAIFWLRDRRGGSFARLRPWPWSTSRL